MDITLNAVEARVLGALIEKERTTPEYYPLSLNALTAACNQKSSRDPVMSLTESEVMNSVETLRNKKLAWQLSTAGGRVPKFERNMNALFSFSAAEISIVSVLLLRGAQTAGEIRNHSDRLYSFSSINEVENSLRQLTEMEGGPFVKELPRQPGRKENRYIQLFTGEPDLSLYESEGTVTRVEAVGEDRISKIEREMAEMRQMLVNLQEEFENFRKMLE
jgi:uncharacterized protein YceH (UPF0502 family)